MKVPIILLYLAFTVGLFAAPKFAVVRVTDIYRELPSTTATQKAIQEQREVVSENIRANRFRAILAELQALEVVLQENKDRIETEDGKKLIRNYEIKRQEAETVRQDFEEFSAAENKRINEEMVAGMRSSLGRITAAATQVARERNLDGILDISGNSNTGIPFVLYSKGAPDITEDVVELLGEKAAEINELSSKKNKDLETEEPKQN
jgi:Skp family chaperone for outer membrane proteins